MQMLVLKTLRSTFLNLGQKLNFLTFLLKFYFFGKQNHYFHFGRNHNLSKPVEQLLSLNDLAQMSILLKR